MRGTSATDFVKGQYFDGINAPLAMGPNQSVIHIPEYILQNIFNGLVFVRPGDDLIPQSAWGDYFDSGGLRYLF
jgi:hypothetical protein